MPPFAESGFLSTVLENPYITQRHVGVFHSATGTAGVAEIICWNKGLTKIGKKEREVIEESWKFGNNLFSDLATLIAVIFVDKRKCLIDSREFRTP